VVLQLPRTAGRPARRCRGGGAGAPTAFFGGEGVFLATLTGPGKVWPQSLPFSRLAGRMLAPAPQRGGHRDEGSVLGGLGNILSGDRDS
jgi:hypothetical protein